MNRPRRATLEGTRLGAYIVPSAAHLDWILAIGSGPLLGPGPPDKSTVHGVDPSVSRRKGVG